MRNSLSQRPAHQWAADVFVRFGKNHGTRTIAGYEFFNFANLQDQPLPDDVRDRVIGAYGDWVENVVAKPDFRQHRPQNRGLTAEDIAAGKGVGICPALTQALENQTVWIAVDPLGSDGEEITTNMLRAKLAPLKEGFFEFEPDNLRGVGIVFPNVSAEDAEMIIQPLVHELKPEFLQVGLLPGFFHPKDKTRSRYHDPKADLGPNPLYPNRGPVPSFFLRRTMPSDVKVFEKFDDAVKVTLYQAFIEYWTAEGKGDNRFIQSARERLAELRRELGMSDGESE
ncbi:MAG: hypothetical protein JNK33_06765 [Candidatus Doudnabacteria bacterium]|nr:hypothetical protein [Candidatus Doudnabacteria bacterium]